MAAAIGSRLARCRLFSPSYKRLLPGTATRSLSNQSVIGVDGTVRSVWEDVALPSEPLWSVLHRRAADFLEETAFVCSVSGLRLTHGQVREMIPRVAASLHALGVRKGDVFCIYSMNLPYYMVLFVALNSLGAVPTLVSPAANADDLERQLRMSGARYLIAVEPLLEAARTACDRVGIQKRFTFGSSAEGFQPFSSLLDGDISLLPDVDISPEKDLCALPYSSGTTGLPKGVMLTHKNLTANLAQINHPEVICLKPGDTTIAVLPFFHIYGMVVVGLNALWSGNACVTMPKFDAEPFLQLVQQHKASVLYNVPPIMLFMAKHPLVRNYDISSVHTVYCGAAPLGAELSDEFQKNTGIHMVRQAYGLTETSPVTHVNPARGWKHGSIGHLVPNTLAKVVHLETGEALGPGEDGELLLGGPQVMQGYLDNEEATRNSLTEDHWFRSGDIGHYTEDGFFYIVDRLKELIKYKGFQVPPAELEGVLLTHPAVADAAVIGVPDEEAGELPRAYVQLKPEAKASEDDIKQFIAEHVAAYKKLRGGVVFIDAVPKTASGKILRKDLKALL